MYYIAYTLRQSEEKTYKVQINSVQYKVTQVQIAVCSVQYNP